jgi:membrane-associated phospholipid phosphatase
MNVFDVRLIASMSHMSIHSQLFTRAVEIVANMYLFKGLVLVALLWWIWFRPETAIGPSGDALRRHNREIVVLAIASGLIALAAGRLLAHYLPFRLRPMYEPQLQGFYPASGLHEMLPRTWSAFPSDHAMLWCAIATGIFLASRPAGIYALLHAVILIGLPRVYLGLHYPTDVMAGVALGVGIACVMNARPIRPRVAAPVLAFAQRYPGVFYGAAFMLSFELTTQFDEVRVLAGGMSILAHAL